MARKPRIEAPTTPSGFVLDTAQVDRAAALAFFLLDTVGSIYGQWRGRMSAVHQRALFGKYIGKGRLWVDGSEESVRMYVKVCFGTDSNCAFHTNWSAL